MNERTRSRDPVESGMSESAALIEEERPKQPVRITRALLLGTDEAPLGVEPYMPGGDVGPALGLDLESCWRTSTASRLGDRIQI